MCNLILRIETWAQIGQNYWATSRPKHQPLDSSSRVEKARTRAASRPSSRCFACGLPSARRFLSLRPRRRPRAGFAVAAQLLLRWPAHISARPCLLCDCLRATLQPCPTVALLSGLLRGCVPIRLLASPGGHLPQVPRGHQPATEAMSRPCLGLQDPGPLLLEVPQERVRAKRHGARLDTAGAYRHEREAGEQPRDLPRHRRRALLAVVARRRTSSEDRGAQPQGDHPM